MSLLEITSIVLILAFLFLVFRMVETNWSYRISKPYAWETSVKNGQVSKRLKRIERFYRDKARFYTIWLQIQRLKKENVPGAFAELGVYRGETARMIHEMDTSRKFHLFDTFSGFDQRDIQDDNKTLIDFSDSHVEIAKKLIAGNDNIIFHQGYFPETAVDLSVEYAFVHLDADLYLPTLAALKYFYPKLAKGGVMIIHDYNHTWDGVRKAMDEFMPGIPEGAVALPDWQGSVVIVRNHRA